MIDAAVVTVLVDRLILAKCRRLIAFLSRLSDERKRSVDLMKVFLETCECNWLAMVICRALLDRMNPDGVVENTSLDLRTIVSQVYGN